MKKLFALCLLVLATATLSAKTIKEFVVTTQPQMSCQNCENKIKKNLRFEKGVTNIQTDLENQVVVVTYDADKTNEENITKAFGKLDYKVSPTSKPGDSGKACTKEKGCCKDKADAKEKGCCKDKADSKEKACCKDKADAKDKKCDGSCKKEGKEKGKDCCKNK